MRRIMVATGEVSGDMHASRVVREIKKMAPDTEFYGMGADYLREEGVEILIDPTEVSTIGFMEAFKNLKVHLRNLKILKNSIDERKPDLIFLVDNSGFNMLMARIAYKKGVPVVNYFSPSAWVWGKWRARWMARYRVTIASVFPMEASVYREAGARVVFVGHPLVDLVQVEKEPEMIMNELELEPDKPVIGLLPGSRYQEIESLLPEMLRTVEKIEENGRDYQFVLPLARSIDRDKLSKIIADYDSEIRVIRERTYEVIKIADLLIAASGTVNLEATIIGTPMVVVYRVSPLTYHLGKRLIRLDYVSPPNIIAGREIVPELLQDEANSEIIYRQVQAILNNPEWMMKMRENLRSAREKLGPPGAVKRTAELILTGGEALTGSE